MNKQLLQTLPLAKGKDIHNRIAKLALYKECIALASSVSDPLVRQHTIVEVREKWLLSRGDGGQTLQLQLASALDRIAYGRMCVSKQRLRLIPNASEKYDWGVVNPLEHHAQRIQRREERESPDAFPHGAGRRDFVPMTNWGYGNMDPDAVMRHKELTDRQHFMGPHWRNKPKPVLLEDLSFEEQMEGMEVAAMSQASLLKDRLLNQGANHFVIFTSVGEVLEWSGDFQNEEKRLLAYTVAQQASTLLRPGEELKRISMVFDNVAKRTAVGGDLRFLLNQCARRRNPLVVYLRYPMKRYFLIDESTGRIMRLLTGENIIRRGAEIAVKGANVVCVGTTCINVSRTHAIIKLCENGEAWLRDCESTNGTFLHSDTGVSVRLEPGFFYQLKRGNHVTFGDLKLRFEWDVIAVCGGRVPVYDSNANLMDSSQGSGMNGASNDLLRLEGTVCSSICASCSLAGTDATPPLPVTLTAASDEKTCAVVSVQLDCGVLCKPLCELENVVPYLSESTGAGRKRSRSVIKNTTDRLSKVKSLPSSATVKSETTARGSRLKPKSKSKGRVKVCFSGMCGEATLAAKFLAKKHCWSIVDNVCMADLLIINHPPVRTPKFIIAVARGIPVVTEEFFACGDMRQVRQFAPSLVHNNCTYDAGRLFQVITSNVGKPALLGRRFSLEKVPPAWRRTARNILTGCGAVVFTKGTKSKSVISLTGATLTALYDDILRGKVPA